MSTATLPALTADQYHADRERLSHSQLEVFIDDPALYHGRFITGEFPAPAATDTMKLGTIIHDAILCGGENCCCIPIPREVLAADGSRRGQKWTEFRDSHPGKFLLKADEFDAVRRSVANVLDHPKARAVLEYEGGLSEQALHWTDEATGIECRGLADRITHKFIADIKTSSTVDPLAFNRKLYDFGYHRQAAWYLAGAKACGYRHVGYVIIAVGNAPPHSVEVFVLDDDYLGLGATENRTALDWLDVCRETNVWRRKGWGQIEELSPPAYLFR